MAQTHLMPFAGIKCFGSNAMLNVSLGQCWLHRGAAGLGSLIHSNSLAALTEAILYPCYQDLAIQIQYVKLGKKKLFPVSMKEICVGVESLIQVDFKKIHFITLLVIYNFLATTIW